MTNKTESASHRRRKEEVMDSCTFNQYNDYAFVRNFNQFYTGAVYTA